MDRKEMLKDRRERQLNRVAKPYLHEGKYNGADLRKIRAEKGVGRPPATNIPVEEQSDE